MAHPGDLESARLQPRRTTLRPIRIVLGLFLALFSAIVPAAAQVTVGENTNMNLAGDVSVGYSGGFGDTINSNHGMTFGGNGRLTGSYYNPKFLSFNFQPYYNRSQNNSTYQSISNSSGFIGGVDLFGGSNFPGSVSFGKVYQGDGQFGIPGINGYTTHGNGQNFSIAWSALLPHLPTVTASFTDTTSNAEVYGASSRSSSANKTFNLQSGYSLKGFRLNGLFTHQTLDSTFPSLLAGVSSQQSNNGSNTINLQTSHVVPLKGDWFFGWNRSSYDGSYSGVGSLGSNSGTINLLTSGVVLNPTRKLNVGVVSTYNTNVFGTLQQSILQAGGAADQKINGMSSSAWNLNTTAYYRLLTHLTLNGQVVHLEQFFSGRTISVTQYGGGANFNYNAKFLGSFNFSVGAVDTATQQGNTGAALVGNVNFSRKIQRWELAANFSYNQAVQTLISTYTTSTYYWGGNVRRRFLDSITWNATAYGSHSGFVRVAGSSSHSEGFTTSVNWNRFGLNGIYSRSGGLSIMTAQGLVPIGGGVPLPVVPNQIVYTGKSVGGGASATIKRFVTSVNYVKANSETINGISPIRFSNRLINARLQCRLRKLYLNGGFTRFAQGITTNGLPSQVNSYYIGISRWFNVF